MLIILLMILRPELLHFVPLYMLALVELLTEYGIVNYIKSGRT